jgi:RecB family exonuclease
VVSLDELIDTTDFGSPVLRRAWYERATKLLDRLYREWPADSKAPIALERPLTLDVDGTTWLGRADRIERTATGGIRIVDYKTGSTIPTIAQAATSLQLGFYALAAIADPELDTDAGVEAELWHPLSSSVSWRRSFDPDNLATVRERLSAAAAGILGENWAARAGAHCARCGVRLVCDRWPEGREAFVG